MSKITHITFGDLRSVRAHMSADGDAPAAGKERVVNLIRGVLESGPAILEGPPEQQIHMLFQLVQLLWGFVENAACVAAGTSLQQDLERPLRVLIACQPKDLKLMALRTYPFKLATASGPRFDDFVEIWRSDLRGALFSALGFTLGELNPEEDALLQYLLRVHCYDYEILVTEDVHSDPERIPVSIYLDAILTDAIVGGFDWEHPGPPVMKEGNSP